MKDPLQDDLPTFTTCFSVARETARKAVRVLRDQGLVQIVQGRGAFVTKASRPPRA